MYFNLAKSDFEKFNKLLLCFCISCRRIQNFHWVFLHLRINKSDFGKFNKLLLCFCISCRRIQYLHWVFIHLRIDRGVSALLNSLHWGCLLHFSLSAASHLFWLISLSQKSVAFRSLVNWKSSLACPVYIGEKRTHLGRVYDKSVMLLGTSRTHQLECQETFWKLSGNLLGIW
jgi:hypothetical protein